MKCDMAMNGQGTDKDNGGMAMSLMAGIGEKQDLEEAGQEAKKSLDIRTIISKTFQVGATCLLIQFSVLVSV